MPAEDPIVSDLARAVLDGTDIDWESAGRCASAETQPLIEEFRLLAGVATVHREATPERTPAWSPAIISRFFQPEPRSWGHLRIVERIGRGASGTVFRAWDPRLDREVALKVMPASRPWDATAVSAIIDEGRLLARVRHPNVVTIHGAEQIGEQVGLSMELVPGPTLEERLRANQRFDHREAAAIGVQVCGAVAAVHRAGLLHRDIKATNVVRADDGRVVLMDFGTGRELDDGSTSDLTGTPLYLSPEVFRGEPATVRSDIYALGVLLFRMVTGSYPVNGTTIGDVRRQHDRGIRVRVRDAAPAVPPALANVIEQAIDPDPARRFASAEAMGAALTAAGRPRSPSIRALAVMGVFAIVAATFTWIAAGSTGRDQASGPRLAVLPFENLGPQSDDGIARGLGSDVQRSLAGLDGIVALAFPSLADAPARQQSVSALAGELRADLVLDGSLRRAGPTVHVRARLVRAADGAELWTQSFDRPEAAVATIKGDIARALARKLSLRQRVALVDRTRSDVYLLLAEARSFQERRVGVDALQAAALFERATELDPDNAQAWAGLSRSLASAHRLRAGDENQPPNPLMQAGAIRAIQLDDWLADAHAAMGTVHAENRDWSRAEAAFRRALELNPSLTSVHTDFALSVLMPLERLVEGVRLLEEAVDLDPTSLDVRRVLAHFLVNARRYDEAIATATWVLDRKPDFPFTKIWLGRALALSGRHDEAVTVLSGDAGLWAYLGYTYAVMGRRADAEALAARHPADARGLMLVFGGLKDKPRALAALERLAASNPWRAATWLQRPEMDVLLGDPRADALRQQLGLPTSGSHRF